MTAKLVCPNPDCGRGFIEMAGSGVVLDIGPGGQMACVACGTTLIEQRETCTNILADVAALAAKKDEP